MGTISRTSNMRSTTLFVVAVLAVGALALPDGTIPEDAVMNDVLQAPPVELSELQTAARSHAEQMLAKSGSNACAAPATATEDEVKKNVEAAQALMDKLNNGAECEHAGKKEVDSAATALTEATAKQSTAQSAYNSAANADVDFGKYKLSQLQEGSCSQFYNSKNYKDAKAKRTAANTALNQAKGATSNAQSALNKARMMPKLRQRSVPAKPRPCTRRNSSR